ncbi:MAG: hypothetical protein LUI13_04775 [Lachnospiraceae bacterium]|nr:hypothetical protein [Lachnospiraceae bacterium]
MAGKKRKGVANQQSQHPPDGRQLERAGPLNAEHQKMLDWLRTVKFRKKLFGGVDEADVWRKLEDLNRLYEASLVAERARYDALLEAQAISARDRPDEDRLSRADPDQDQQPGRRQMARGNAGAAQTNGEQANGWQAAMQQANEPGQASGEFDSQAREGV